MTATIGILALTSVAIGDSGGAGLPAERQRNMLITTIRLRGRLHETSFGSTLKFVANTRVSRFLDS